MSNPEEPEIILEEDQSNSTPDSSEEYIEVDRKKEPVQQQHEKQEAKGSILKPIYTRYRRELWIPEDAIMEILGAVQNTIKSGVKLEDIPAIYLYPILLEADSSSQTGQSRYKNKTSMNEYGILDKQQMLTTFKSLEQFPNWERCFVPLKQVLTLDNFEESLRDEIVNYPIYVPCSNYLLLEHFCFIVRSDIFKATCG